MAKRITVKPSRVGLTNGKIDWDQYLNCVVERFADKGLYGRVIARHTGLTTGQVYNRCKRLGIKLRDYRNGKSPAALVVVKKFAVKTASNITKDDTVEEVNNILRIKKK
jgi:hypothetical protein